MRHKLQITLLFTAILTLLCGHATAQLDASALMRGQQNAARGNSLAGMQQNGMNNSYGTNPYDTNQEGENGEQQGEQADSTKKEKKPRKPLESYFFSDSVRSLRNFQWTVDRNTNKVNIAPIEWSLPITRPCPIPLLLRPIPLTALPMISFTISL